MKFIAKVKNGKIEFYDKAELKEFLAKLENKNLIIDIEKHIGQRTITQNRALHLWFGQVADALNESGQDMRAVIRDEVDIPWTTESVKEYLWRPVQKIYLQKHSTTKLNKSDEIDRVFDILNRLLGERAKIHIPFPSED